MSAVTGFRRIRILAIAAHLAAGCGATPPTSVPATATPSTGQASAAPASPVTPTTPPDEACDDLDEFFLRPAAHFSMASPLGGSSSVLSVTRVSANDDPAQAIEFRRRKPYLDDPIRLVGRSQVRLVAEDEELGELPITLIDATAILRIDGIEQVEMAHTVTADPDSGEAVFAFDVADIRGSGVIEFTVAYSDECFTYVAEGGRAFQMVRAAFAAACPTDSDGFVTHWESMGKPNFEVGGVGVELSPDEMIALWSPGAIGSQGNDPLSHWDAEAAAPIASTGGTAVMRPTNPRLRIESVTAAFYRRGTVVSWLSGGDDPFRAFLATADPYPDGHLDLLVPSDPGRYVVGLVVRWETPCLRGGAVGALSMDVE